MIRSHNILIVGAALALLTAAAPAAAKPFKPFPMKPMPGKPYGGGGYGGGYGYHHHWGYAGAGIGLGLLGGAIAASAMAASQCSYVQQPVTDAYGNFVGYTPVRVCE